jgi:nucleotide-binding universal stress UspA family protein
MTAIRKILVPVDLSTCSRLALERALALADQLQAHVTVFHVAELSPETAHLQLAEGGGGTLEEFAVKTARRELEEFVKTPKAKARQAFDVRVEAGRPRDRILKRSEEGYDLIVMGTHGRTGRLHSLAGSVTESVVRMASIPVLTVRASE